MVLLRKVLLNISVFLSHKENLDIAICDWCLTTTMLIVIMIKRMTAVLRAYTEIIGNKAVPRISGTVN